MTSMLNDTVNNAKNVMETAREGTEHAVAKTRDRFVEGFRAVTEVVAMLRALNGDDALGWVGLARRTGPFQSIAVFGAGMAVGAGAGMLFAPMSGVELRRALLGKITAQAQDAATRVEANVKEVEEKGEDLVRQAADAVKKVERKIENKVNAGAEAVKDAGAHGAGHRPS